MIITKWLLRCYLLLSIMYLYGILYRSDLLEFYGKPLLLLPLVFAVFFSKNFGNKPFLLVALFFSWIGDILLLFAPRDAAFFIFGLVAFLAAHLFYILLFMGELKKITPKTKWDLQSLLIILAYLVALLFILIPHLGGLTVPVVVYALVISSMLYLASLLSHYWPKPFSILLLTGAVSFILSDSILAINKFYMPFPMAGFIIMTTYLYAQWALVKSCLKGA